MARTTLTTRVTNLESAVASLAEGQSRIIALLEAGQPAKVTTRKPASPKAKAAPAVVVSVSGKGHTFTGERVGSGSRKLTTSNRKSFIAAHSWALPHTSVSGLRNAVAAGAPVAKGWNVAI